MHAVAAGPVARGCARCGWIESAPSIRLSRVTRRRTRRAPRLGKSNLSQSLGRACGRGGLHGDGKLLELAANPSTDLLVLDTPPAAEAIDFLDAPRRLLELLNSRAVVLLGAPAGLFRSQLRMVDIAARAVLAAFDRVTGLNLLSDIQSFVRSFDGMYEGFSARAARAQDKLRAPDTAIVIVTTAESSRIAQAREFIGALERAGLRVGAMVVNRVIAELPDAAELSSARIAPSLKRKLKRNLADYAALKTREEVSLSALRNSLPGGAVLMVAPDLGREPRTIADLAEIGRSLRAG